jgi:prepilin-type N-terminal cleavage/methylation domain-containing protein
MSRTSTNSSRGFTLIELLVSLAVGTLVVGAAVQLFSQGMNATFVVSQRAEMQQDLRASSNLLLKDISLAGAGLPQAQGLSLPATGVKPIYGYAPSCVAKNNCVPGGGIAYPCSSLAGACTPTLYGLIPGFRLGITPPGNANPSDVITIVYTDSVFALNCYQLTSITATTAVFLLPVPLPASCILPPGLPAPQAVTDGVVGLTVGDVVLFQGTGGPVVAEVSDVPIDNGGGQYTVKFNVGDTLNLNQPAAASSNLVQMANKPPALPPTTDTATRIFVISYYLWMMPDPLGVGPGTPTLMRQVNGHTPTPVGEGVVNLQFTYDTYNTNGTLLNASGDGGYSTGTSFNLIRKINLVHLTTRSQVAGAKTGLMTTNGYQTFDTQTSISARNLSYQNRYSFTP